MKAKTKIVASAAALVALSVALMVAFGQAGDRAELLRVAASFLGVDPAQLEAFEVGLVAGERDVYAVKGSLPLEGQPGQGERVRLQINLPQRLVVKAEWPDHGSDLAASGEVGEDRLREVAEAFARTHCPFWTDDFQSERHGWFPVNKRSFYICSWTSPPQAGRGACRVSLCLRAADQQPFVYGCSYVPPDKLGGVTIAQAQALEIARAFLLEKYEGAARITGHRFHQYNRHYETPLWYVEFLVEREGMETWADAVFINARNGAILWPPADE